MGRPPENESYYQKAKRKKEHNQRNHIEGKFGQGKNTYGLSQIAAKTREASESWISNIFFVMNLVKVQQTLMALWMIWGIFFGPIIFTRTSSTRSIIIRIIGEC